MTISCPKCAGMARDRAAAERARDLAIEQAKAARKRIGTIEAETVEAIATYFEARARTMNACANVDDLIRRRAEAFADAAAEIRTLDWKSGQGMSEAVSTEGQ